MEAERMAAVEQALADKSNRLAKAERLLEKHEETLQDDHATEDLKIAKNLNTICLVSWLFSGLTGKHRPRFNMTLDDKLKGKT
jgi:hypothetical protein